MTVDEFLEIWGKAAMPTMLKAPCDKLAIKLETLHNMWLMMK